MANTDSPSGFTPVCHISGAPYNGAVNAYIATDSTAMFVGDLVVMTGEARATQHNGNPGGSLPIIKRATAGKNGQITGAVVSVEPTSQSSTVHRAASENNRIIWVCDDPHVLFKAQTDGTMTQTDVGSGSHMLDANAGSTTTGRSGMEINVTTATGSTNIQLMVHRASPDENNDITAANSDWLVRINMHTSNPTTPVVDIA